MRALDPAQYRDIVRRALEEDVGSGDVTTDRTILPTQRARGVFLVKADCVLAGAEVATEAFRQIEPSVQSAWWKGDGDRCRAGEEIGEMIGSARRLHVTSGIR